MKTGGDHETGEHGEGHVHQNYPITTIDFSRVETPFIIGVWILFASVAKIGELHPHANQFAQWFCDIKITSVLSSSISDSEKRCNSQLIAIIA
jgi:hypothetical protein